ncbi:MAG: PKD domain-containing protein [Alphaproteobacteria bacterium]|nr:PKD domain-containing protein [Alphaproteobacteria bacterium]
MVPLLFLSAPAFALVTDAGGPYTVDAGDAITLSAEASILTECTRVEYSWDLDGDGVIDAVVADDPTVVFDAADLDGPLVVDVELGVSCEIIDGVGLDDRAWTTVTVNNVAPELGEPRIPASIEAGDTVLLSIDATDVEPADRITIAWDLGDGDTARGTEIAHAWAEPGTYALVVTASDDDGGSDRWEGSIEVVPVEDPGDDGGADGGADSGGDGGTDGGTGDGGTDGGTGDGGTDGGTGDGGGRDTFVDGGDTGSGLAPEYEILGTGCSCGSGGAAAVFLPMLLMGWRRRR